MDPREEEVARVLYPALLGVCHDQHFSKLDHFLEHLKKYFLDLDQHMHVLACQLLEVCDSTLVLREEEVGRQHRVIPVQDNQVLMRPLLLRRR